MKLLSTCRSIFLFIFSSRKKLIDKVCTIIAIFFIIFYIKMYGKKQFYNGFCPKLVWEKKAGTNGSISCKNIIEGYQDEIDIAEKYFGCKQRTAIKDDEYSIYTRNCSKFKQMRLYDNTNTPEEINFPLAYSILMYENVYQMENMLNLIYKPQNVYCIHVDASSSKTVIDAVRSIVKCFDNVFIATDRILVKYGEISIVEAEINCLRDLWKFPNWKYFINLTGKELPIRTNEEIVKILKSYKGANDVFGLQKGRPKSWTSVRWMKHSIPLPIPKGPPPHNFTLTKGSTHIAVTRDFVDYVLHNKKSHELLEWMRDVRVPDEQYFNTLSHSPHLKIPGAYIGVPDDKIFLTRYKLWRQDHSTCHGAWIHGICNFGPADLRRLTQSPALFANKFKPEWDSITYQCLSMWHRLRTDKQIESDFDIEFYENQPWVKNHV